MKDDTTIPYKIQILQKYTEEHVVKRQNGRGMVKMTNIKTRITRKKDGGISENRMILFYCLCKY